MGRNNFQRHKMNQKLTLRNNLKQKASLPLKDPLFIGNYDIETDFKPMIGRESTVSSPSKYSKSTSKIAESHSKLLKNIKYGVDGSPLDIWMPVQSAEIDNYSS